MKKNKIIFIVVFVIIITLFNSVYATYDIPIELVISNNDLSPFAQEIYNEYYQGFDENNFTKFFAFYDYYEYNDSYVLNLVCATSDTTITINNDGWLSSDGVAWRFAIYTDQIVFYESPQIHISFLNNSYDNGYFYTTFDFSLTADGTTYNYTTTNNPMNITIVDQNGNDYVNIQNSSSGNNNDDNSSLISASAIESIGTTLTTNLVAISPTILSVLSITIVVVILLKFIRDNTKKG